MSGLSMSVRSANLRAWQRNFEINGETPAIAAATVVVLRDGPAGVESLMLRRNSRIAFGGMWVFPGGRIEREDHRSAGNPVDLVTAARNAAVREAREETALRLNPETLVQFSYWIAPPIAPKRFATWFFASPEPAGDVAIDESEIIRHEWMTPAEAKRHHNEGAIELAPPTWVTLHTLDTLSSKTSPDEAGSVSTGDIAHRGHTTEINPQAMPARPRAADVLTRLSRRRHRHYETRIGLSPEGPVSMWHGDAGYNTGDPTVPGPRHRLEMSAGCYRFQDHTDERT